MKRATWARVRSLWDRLLAMRRHLAWALLWALLLAISVSLVQASPPDPEFVQPTEQTS